MSAREVHITVINVSNTELQVESKTYLNHGEWITTPTNVPNNGMAVNFRADSDGFATGVEGTIYYSVPGGELQMYFDDPYAGADGFNGKSTAEHYDVRAIGGSGNVCNVTYLVTNK